MHCSVPLSSIEGAQSQLSVGRKPGNGVMAEKDVWLMISNQQNRSGNSYKVCPDCLSHHTVTVVVTNMISYM